MARIPHRTPAMKAQSAAKRHARTPEELDRLLRQFSPERRPAILERLRAHLSFDPDSAPVEPK
jgi:hypothetical protein